VGSTVRKRKRENPWCYRDIIVIIEHIGSTAVRGLGGKPRIDLMIGVRERSDADKCMEPLRKTGYKHVPDYEETIPERRFLHKGSFPIEQIYPLHLVEKNSVFWKLHLLFRDYLRTHPDVAQEYYQLKKELASKYGSNREGNNIAKSRFIESVLCMNH
jgi:GrpB-like predicted nucleotidyltransferase (UPF0157 family)